MRLQDLPPEVMAHVLKGRFTSASVLELWKSGDRALMAKMANGGVQEVYLKSVYPRDDPATWPRCLKEFRLRILNVKQFMSFGPIDALKEEIKLLHPGLKSLKLDIEGAYGLFFPDDQDENESSDEDSDEDSDDDYAPTPKRIKVNDVSTPLLDLRVLFKELESFSLGDRLRTYFMASDLPLLPPSLTAFRVYTIRMKENSELASLPPGLTSLRLMGRVIAPEHLPFLPKSLTQLEGFKYSLIPEFVDHRPELPNLTKIGTSNAKLHVRENGYLLRRKVDGKFVINQERYHLTDLENAKDAFSALPIGTKYLRTTSSECVPITHEVLTKHFPASLTELIVERVDWKDISANLWPKTLTRFTVYDDDQTGHHQFHQMPRSLTYLMINLYRHSKASVADSDDLPFLEIGRTSLASELEVWTQRKLCLRKYASESEQSRVEQYIAGVEKGSLFGLPLGLLNLSLGPSAHQCPLELILPPRLTRLILTAWNSLQHKNFFERLPTSLAHLSFSQYHSTASDDLEDDDFDVKEVIESDDVTPGTIDFCRLLPPSLRSLTLDGINYKDLPYLRALPSSLESLIIGNVTALPQLVKSDLSGLVDPLSDSKRWDGWLAALPRSLKHLKLGDTHFFNHHLAELPPTLETLCVGLDRSVDDLWALPRTLRTITNANPTRTKQTARRESPLFELSTYVRTLGKVWSLKPNVAKVLMGSRFDEVNRKLPKGLKRLPLYPLIMRIEASEDKKKFKVRS